MFEIQQGEDEGKDGGKESCRGRRGWSDCGERRVKMGGDRRETGRREGCGEEDREREAEGGGRQNEK